jgi:hypothetical protein|tara:strand:- start:428 stop:829 length:402 start_codon:yes stop_codon:yes gene_type:complete
MNQRQPHGSLGYNPTELIIKFNDVGGLDELLVWCVPGGTAHYRYQKSNNVPGEGTYDSGPLDNDNVQRVADLCHGLEVNKLRAAVELVEKLAQLVEPELDESVLMKNQWQLVKAIETVQKMEPTEMGWDGPRP